MRTSEKRRGDARKRNCNKCWGPPISRHEMAPPNSKYSDQSEESVERGSGFTTPSCSLIFKTFPLASCTYIVSGGSTSLSMGGVTAVGSSSNRQPAASERLPRIARTHLALLSTTLIAMGAVILYLSSICHSRSSPSYTFNSHSAVSAHSQRTIVKSSISCAISAVLAPGLESAEPKICRRGILGRRLHSFSSRILHRRSIFRSKMERVSEALQLPVVIEGSGAFSVKPQLL